MQAPFFLIVPPSIINVLPHSVHTVVAVLCTSWAAVRAKPRRSVLHTGQELLLTLPRVCATSFFIGPCHGNWACGGALVVTVRGWRNWRMLGLHPGETLVTLLPTFCCSVPRGVSFFFFFLGFAGRCIPRPGGTFCGSLSIKKRVVFLLGWAGDACGAFYSCRQLTTCLFLWGRCLLP